MKKWISWCVAFCCFFTPLQAQAYYTKGNQIYNEAHQKMNWNGLNWFGFETTNYAPHGLWARSIDDMLDQMKKKGYNLIRVPYSNDIFKNVTPNGIDFSKNPTLQNKSSLQILDQLIKKASKRKMYILLDRHRPDAYSQSALWYTATVSEKQWRKDWVKLAKRYKGNPTVIGADLHNEPHGAATWGSGNKKTDWRLAAERAGNELLAVNPEWLIVVEGIESYKNDYYWWGGNLQGVKKYPVRLKTKNKIVYSTHDYGPGVYKQPWFQQTNFTKKLPALWDKQWGYIHKQKIAPVLIGEFGGHQTAKTTAEGQWQRTLISYIDKNKLYWTYWSLNPNSGDTGGLLLDDWTTWHTQKQAILQKIMQ